MFSGKKHSVPGLQFPNHDMAKEQSNFGHSMSFPEQHSFQSKSSLDKKFQDSGSLDDGSSRRENSKYHLSDIDREEMEKMFSPAQRFDDVLRVDDRVPEVFMPADTHHYDDEDYRNHRHRSYPHMHQPLKSMEPRALRKIKERIRQCKEAERRAAQSGVASSVPQLLSRAQASGNTSHVVHLAVASTVPAEKVISGNVSGPLILPDNLPSANVDFVAGDSELTTIAEPSVDIQPATEPMLETAFGPKKRKRRRHRSRKAEPFLPTLSHLSEESATPSSLSSNEDDYDDDEQGEYIEENMNEDDSQTYSVDGSNDLSSQDYSDAYDGKYQNNKRPELYTAPSWPGATLLAGSESPCPSSHLTIIGSPGSVPQMSFLEEIATEIQPVSFMEHTKGAYLRNLSMPALSSNNGSPRSQSPHHFPLMSRRQSIDSSGSQPKINRKISFADEQQQPSSRSSSKLQVDEWSGAQSHSGLVPLMEESVFSGEDKTDLDPATPGSPAMNTSSADMKRKPSFHLGGEYQFPEPSQQSETVSPEGSHNKDSIGNASDDTGSTSSTPYHRSNSSRFHHKEHYRAKDLRERTFSGIELRDLQQEREVKQVTEAEEADTLIAADLNTIFSHRFEDMPAFRNRTRRPPPLTSMNAMKSKKTAAINNSGCQTVATGGDILTDEFSALHPSLSLLEGDYQPQISSTNSTPHPLFVEMDVLSYQERHQQWQWREKARWIQYEEDLNEAADRFDPAHCPPLRFHTLLQFRRYLEQSTILLDLPCDTLTAVTERVVQSLQSSGTCNSEEAALIEEALHLRHIHVGENSRSNLRNDLAKSRGFTTPANMNLADTSSTNKANGYEENEPLVTSPSAQQIETVQIKSHPSSNKFFRRPYKSDLVGRLKGGFESASVNVGCLEHLRHPVMIFVRLANQGLRNSVVDENNRLTEIDEELPVRFIFHFLGPPDSCFDQVEYSEIGRVFSTMMIDPNFRTTAYSAQNRDDLLEGLRLFLDNSVVVPLLNNDWNARALVEMNTHLRNYMRKKDDDTKIKASQQKLNFQGKLESHSEAASHHSEEYSSVRCLDQGPDAASQFSVMGTSHFRCCDWLCPPFASLYRDMKGYRMRLQSDLLDAFSRDNIATVLLGIFFVYFAVLAPAITFGALMNQTISESFGIILCLISSGVFQLLFTLIGGQPMIIIGITGPVFIIEASTYLLSLNLEIDLFVLRFWVAMYAALFGLIIVGFNLVIIVSYIRRSVEEIFNTFVGFYYLFKALFTMLKYIPSSGSYSPTTLSTIYVVNESAFNMSSANNSQYVPNLDLKRAQAATTFFLAFIMLAVSLALVELKRGKYFTRKMRIFLGSFNVPLGIVVVVLLERVVFADFHLERLNIPPLSSNGSITTLYTLPNLNVKMKNPVAVHAISALVGICLTMLIGTETMISGVSVAKTERKLTKPCLFSLDFFVSLVIFPVISGVLGWPFVSGAVVKSNSHVIAMTKWDHKTVPGVPHRILGCAEQRISGTVVGTLLALSILFGPLLKYIPMAAMYGIFLYMGIMGLRDLQFVRRTMSLLKRRKHWPETDYLRNLRVKHFMALGAFQALTISILITFFCLKEFANIAYPMFSFPIVLLSYALAREFLMPKWNWFNRHLDEMDSRHKIVLLGFTTSSIDGEPSTGDETNVKPNFYSSKSQSALQGEVHTHGLRNRLRSVPADLESAVHRYLVLPVGVDPDIQDQLIERREFDEENPYPHG